MLALREMVETYGIHINMGTFCYNLIAVAKPLTTEFLHDAPI